jgi:hypothetical protein
MKLDFKYKSLDEVILSILWGFGLAMVFKKVCHNNCVVIRENRLHNKNDVIKKDHKCYKLQKQNNSCKAI